MLDTVEKEVRIRDGEKEERMDAEGETSIRVWFSYRGRLQNVCLLVRLCSNLPGCGRIAVISFVHMCETC